MPRPKDRVYYVRSKERYKYAVIRMERDQYAAVEEMARRANVSTAEMLRTLVEWGLSPVGDEQAA